MKRTREAPHSSRQLEGILQKRRLLDAKLLWYTTILRKVCVNAWPTRGRQLPLLHYSVIERKITFVGWGWDLPCSCLFLAIIIISLFVPWHCVCLSPFLPPLFGSAPAASSSSVRPSVLSPLHSSALFSSSEKVGSPHQQYKARESWRMHGTTNYDKGSTV